MVDDIDNYEETMNTFAESQAKSFYVWAEDYKAIHIGEFIKSGKMPTVNELWLIYKTIH